jgi:hypothetical protein
VCLCLLRCPRVHHHVQVLELLVECDGSSVFLIVVVDDAAAEHSTTEGHWSSGGGATQHRFLLDSSPDAYCFEPWVAATDEFTPELLDFLPLFNMQAGDNIPTSPFHAGVSKLLSSPPPRVCLSEILASFPCVSVLPTSQPQLSMPASASRCPPRHPVLLANIPICQDAKTPTCSILS